MSSARTAQMIAMIFRGLSIRRPGTPAPPGGTAPPGALRDGGWVGQTGRAASGSPGPSARGYADGGYSRYGRSGPASPGRPPPAGTCTVGSAGPALPPAGWLGPEPFRNQSSGQSLMPPPHPCPRCPHRPHNQDASVAKLAMSDFRRTALPPDRDHVATRGSEVSRVLGIHAGRDERGADVVGPPGREAQPPPGDVDKLGETRVVRPALLGPAMRLRSQAHSRQDLKQIG